MSKRKQAPYDPAYSRYLLRKAGKSQVDLSNELGISRSAITMFLDNRAYSQRFWDLFEKTVASIKDAA
jgi:predicted transcriptional regulator